MRVVKHRGMWAVRFDGRRLSTGYRAEPHLFERAEQAARQILEDWRRFEAAKAGAGCAQIVDAYLADMPKRANPKQVTDAAKYGAERVKAHFSSHRPHQVSREECRAYVEKRRGDGVSDGTIRRELSILQAALRWADPATPARFDLPAPPPPRDRWLTRDEFQKLIDAADLPHVKTFLHIAIATGARKEAILGMTWQTHVDLEKGSIWPGFKAGGKNRAQPLPMTPDCKAALSVAESAATSAYVIEWAGKPVKDIRRALRRVYERAGLTDVKAPAHVLRHTAGAWMAQAGVPLHEIARRLGHSSIRVTERHYAHLHPDFMGKSTDALTL